MQRFFSGLFYGLIPEYESLIFMQIVYGKHPKRTFICISWWKEFRVRIKLNGHAFDLKFYHTFPFHLSDIHVFAISQIIIIVYSLFIYSLFHKYAQLKYLLSNLQFLLIIVLYGTIHDDHLEADNLENQVVVSSKWLIKCLFEKYYLGKFNE